MYSAQVSARGVLFAVSLAAAAGCRPSVRPPDPPPIAVRADAGAAPLPAGAGAQGTPCADGRCQPGLACVEYYGVAGPSGPRFTSCEIRCASPTDKCPRGQRCTTISDGPGRVCRPSP